MRILYIAREQLLSAITLRLLRNELGPDHTILSVPREALSAPNSRMAVVQENFDLIVLPLSVPNSGSIHIAELIHRLNSLTRLILFSGTETSKELLVPLFDDVVSSWSLGKDLAATIHAVLGRPVKRVQNQKELEESIVRVIENAHHFRHGAHDFGAPDSLRAYRASLESPGLGTFAFAEFPRRSPDSYIRKKALNLFVSYSHKDEAYRQELAAHLSPLRREGLIHLWHDRLLVPGEVWDQSIEDRIRETQIFLLLISADFFQSAACYEQELTEISKEAFYSPRYVAIVPILLRPVDWSQSWLAKYQALPSNGQAVSIWENPDAAWADVAAGIRRTIDRLQGF
ncbi:MAG: toll/interleukin-1 receptor domain-containing protein [Verrucomicrobiales bacterium]|nr:toll/interleukin-1 receptor domain-containing protein [Verrucomicrobiales bacterium]